MNLLKSSVLRNAIVTAGIFVFALPTQANLISPEVIFGSGNANGSFTIDENTYGDPAIFGQELPVVELGLRGKLRFNDSNLPENTFNWDGVDTYTFAAGLPPTGFGFAPGSTTTALWNFEWAINTDADFNGLPLIGGTTLNAFTYELRIDGDAGAGTNFLVFDPINQAPADHAIGNYFTANGAGLVAADAAEYATLINENNVAQNSWNYEFFNNPGTALESFDPTVAGMYRIELEAFYQGVSIANTGININVVSQVSAPGIASLMLAGFGMLLFSRRQKR